MQMQNYERQALKTLATDHGMQDLTAKDMSQVLGLVGEAGEVAELVKKQIRDKNGEITPDFMNNLEKELGDVLYYVTSLGHCFGLHLDQIAETNINKLTLRAQRGTLKGNGDDR